MITGIFTAFTIEVNTYGNSQWYFPTEQNSLSSKGQIRGLMRTDLGLRDMLTLVYVT